MRTKFAIIAALWNVLAVGGPAHAFTDYRDCLGQVQADPAAALPEAREWARLNIGGAPARHCYAMALLATGAALSAADELVNAAVEEPGLANAERARLMVQAGEILLEAGEELSPALIAEQAVSLDPKGAGPIGLRGRVKLAGGNANGAIADLDEALRIGGPDARLLTSRAAARRQAGQATAARDDALWATELDKTLPEAWLERGRAEALVGARHEARQSFLKAIDLSRESPTARAAQLALQKMDAK